MIQKRHNSPFNNHIQLCQLRRPSWKKLQYVAYHKNVAYAFLHTLPINMIPVFNKKKCCSAINQFHVLCVATKRQKYLKEQVIPQLKSNICCIELDKEKEKKM